MTNQQAKQILQHLLENEQLLINAAYAGMSVVDLISQVSQSITTSERQMDLEKHDKARFVTGSHFPQIDPQNIQTFKDPLNSPLG